MAKPAFDALQRLAAARPWWFGVRPAGEAVPLRGDTLLHAGPPLGDPSRPPAPLLSAAVMTLRHAGVATDDVDATAQLAAGRWRWRPAQDLGVVTPLAAVVASGTPMLGVADAAKPGAAPLWAPLSPLGGPDTRFGHRDPAIGPRLQERDTMLAPALDRLLDTTGPIALWPLAEAGLAAGDDLHSRTAGANAALAAELARRGLAQPLVDGLVATPLFFLTLWMAACAAILRRAEGGDRPTLVTRGGGNGERFGIGLAGRPGHWVSIAAPPPAGWRLPSAPANAAVLGAIGDSAVIDLLGFGGQRLALAPEPLSVLGPALPPDHAETARHLLQVPLPRLSPPWSIGLDAADVVAHDRGPLVALAMVAADGRQGLLGRGVVQLPPTLFADACRGLA